MKISPTVRRILGITAFAWSIPLAQAGDALSRESKTEAERGSKALKVVPAASDVAAVRDRRAKPWAPD